MKTQLQFFNTPLMTLVASALLWEMCASAAQYDEDVTINSGNFTLRQDALLEGSVLFGRIQHASDVDFATYESSSPGFRISVSQTTRPYQREVVIPAHQEMQTVSIDDYDWRNKEVWVEDYGWVSTLTDEPVYGDTFPGVPVDAQYDLDGNLITEAYVDYTIPVYGITGYNQVTGQIWGLIGGHWETSGELEYVVVGSHTGTEPVWVGETRTSESAWTFNAPVIQSDAFSGDAIWQWMNAGRSILEVSNAGISVPFPGDTMGGTHRSMMTSTQFEQSATEPHRSLVTLMTANGFATGSQSLETPSSMLSELQPGELRIQKQVQVGETTSEITATRIGPETATFAGSVAIKGVLRIQPAGDIGMGEFNHGPQP